MHRALWRVREFYANSELLGKSPSRIAFVLCCEVQRGKFLRGIAQVRRKEYDKVANDGDELRSCDSQLRVSDCGVGALDNPTECSAELTRHIPQPAIRAASHFSRDICAKA